MPEATDQPSELGSLLQEVDTAKRLAESGLWGQITAEHFPRLAEDPWTLAGYQVQGIDTALHRLDQMRRAAREAPDLVAKVSLVMGELYQKVLGIVGGLPQPDGSVLPFPVFCWLGNDDRAALEAALVHGIPEAVNTTNIVALMGMSPETVARFVELARVQAQRQQATIEAASRAPGFSKT